MYNTHVENKKFTFERRQVSERRLSKLIKKYLCPFNLILPSENKHNFDVTLNGYLTQNSETKQEQTKTEPDIEELLQFLNFFAKHTDRLQDFEVTKEFDNDPETWKQAYDALQDFTIEQRYRAKNSVFEYWVFRNGIYRKKAKQNRLYDSITCRFCGKKQSKFNRDCWNCGNPLGE